MTREQLLAAYAAHRAAAAACEAALKGEAAATFATQRSADTWRMASGTVTTRLTRSRASVHDRAALVKWLTTAYPTEVETHTVTVTEVRNEAFLTRLLAGLTPVDPDDLDPGEATGLMTADGTVVPGVVWTRGGQLSSVALAPDSDLARRFEVAARAYVETGTPMPAISARPHTETGEDGGT